MNWGYALTFSLLLSLAAFNPVAQAVEDSAQDLPGAARSLSAESELEQLRRRPQAAAILWHQWRPASEAIARGEFARLGPSREAALRLTLKEAVATALGNNPGIAAQRLSPLIGRENVRQALSAFDPVASLEVSKARRESPNPSALAGTLANVNTNFDANFRLGKLTRSGAQLALDFTNNRLRSNAIFESLVPRLTSELTLSLTQPLLRDFGYDFSYLLVRINRVSSKAQHYAYEAALNAFVKRIVEAYWNLVFARENLKVQEESLRLAREIVKQNRARVDVGLLPPVAVKEAETEAALREEQVIEAANALDLAEKTLRQVTHLEEPGALRPRAIEPAEDPSIEPVTVDPQEALATALERRPEMLASALELKAAELTVRLRENQLLPRLDLVGSAGLNGLAGDAKIVEFGGQQFSTRFDGDYLDTLDRLGSTDFYSFSAGVRVEVPLGNAAAKSDYTKSKIELSRSELQRRQLVSDISLEVDKAAGDVTSALKRVAASRLARELAEENLRNQQKRFEVGMATTTDILDFQEDLTKARAAEVKAAIDYNVSLADLERAKGTLLERYSIVLEEPGEEYVPWWARL